MKTEIMTIDRAYEIMRSRGPESMQFTRYEVSEAAKIVARVQNAAPDLLEACKLAVDECDSIATALVQRYGQTAHVDPLAMLVVALRAAIAKATSEHTF